jgi:hypothetical protein
MGIFRSMFSNNLLLCRKKMHLGVGNEIKEERRPTKSLFINLVLLIFYFFYKQSDDVYDN